MAFDYLVSKGLRDFQAAGIIGNLQQESRLNPRAVSPPDPVEPSRGIAQWQPPGWQKLIAFAAQTGRDPWALDVQLEFLWHQLESEPYLGLSQLLTSTTIEDATIIFQNSFERPKAQLAATQNRIAYAKSALYACPAVKPPPEPPRRGGVALAAAGVFALVAAAGYGVYKAISSRAPKPEPRPEPIFPPPTYRPVPMRPPWRP